MFIELRQEDSRFQRVASDPVAVQGHFRHVMRFGEDGIDEFAVTFFDFEDEIGANVTMNDWCMVIQCAADPRHGWQFVVINLDGLHPIQRGEPGFSDDAGDRIAHMTHLAVGQDRLELFVHRTSVAERHRMHTDQFAVAVGSPILGRQNPENAGHGGRFVCREGQDVGVRMRASNEGGIGHVWQHEIVRILTPAREETLILPPAQPLPEIHHAVLEYAL